MTTCIHIRHVLLFVRLISFHSVLYCLVKQADAHLHLAKYWREKDAQKCPVEIASVRHVSL